MQCDFATRPDLVTLPLPSFSGSAAIPSAVDVYVNDVRTISQDVDSGPFRMTNLPILSGQGNANIIVRDTSGRDVETTLPFLVSNKLLRGGLFDFSVEAGFPRLFYGTQSNVYDDKFAGSGSLRYGCSDHLTLEAHTEATNGLANGGIGASLGIDRAGCRQRGLRWQHARRVPRAGKSTPASTRPFSACRSRRRRCGPLEATITSHP